MPSTILLVDDHPLFRRGLRLLLEEEQDIKVVGEAGDGQEAIDRVRELSPDVVVMDITMPGLSGIDATRQIVAAFPDTRVVALSIHSGKHFVEDMLRAGAAGYILKECAPEELLIGIRTVIRGDRFLSASITGVVVSEYMSALSQTHKPGERPELSTLEKEIVDLLIDGVPLKRIAAILQIDVKVATSTREQIMQKLGARNVGELREVVQTDRPQSAPLLLTKLHRPKVGSDILPRKRLLENINHCRNIPLTLISAPAGYGKSMLASAMLETVGMPNGWVSLDQGDNDLRVFLAYVTKALESMFPGALRKTQSLIEVPNLPPLSILTNYLLNDLDDIDDEFILVLDDYQHIREKTIHGVLTDLLRHPPLTMHLVLVTRHDPLLPLSTLRANGQLNEITTKDLRFSRAETAEFLEQLLNVPIDDETTALLDEKIEGWVTGLRLAALSMHGEQDLSRLVKGFKTGVQYITEYLLGEVLLQQPDDILQYLMKTSIVNRFCPELCEAIHYPKGVPARHGTRGKAFIEWLEKANLFLIPLDDEGRWFRYHHLFQQLLQNQLRRNSSTEDIGALHSLASSYFASQGFVEEAIQHALAAGEMSIAADLFEQNRYDVQNNDQWYVIEKWLALFPEKTVQSQPALLLAKAWVLYHQFRFEAILPTIEAADGLLSRHTDQEILSGEVEFFRGYCCYFLNQGPASLTHLHKALEKIPETHHEIRGQAELMFGLSQQMEGQEETAVQMLHDLLHQSPSPHTLRKTRLTAGLAYIHILSGQLLEAFSANQQLLDVADKNKYAYAKAWSHYLRGLIHFMRNEMEAAILHFGLAYKQRYILHTRAAVDCMIGLIFAHEFMCQSEKANTMLTSLLGFVQSLEDSSYDGIAQSCRARLSIMRGQPEQAMQWLEEHETPGIEVMFCWIEIPAISYCRALLYDGSGRCLQEAEEKLLEYLQMNQAHHNTCQTLHILLLLSLVYEKQGRPVEASSALERALALAKPGGFIYPFIELGHPMSRLLGRVVKNSVDADDIQKILDAFNTGKPVTVPEAEEMKAVSAPAGVRPSPASQPLVEPLTNRELDILDLLAKRFSNKEIAEKLYISTETVKTHLSNIYQKLAVGTRRQAVEIAGELGII